MNDPRAITLDESDRQLVMLALAILSLDRPGWHWTLGRLAEIYSGREMFEEFRRLNADRWAKARVAPLGPPWTDNPDQALLDAAKGDPPCDPS
jgi:hypothetical protein